MYQARRKYFLKIVFFILLLVAIAPAQTIRININESTTEPPEQFQPGFFYNNTNTAANAVFNTSGIHCNCLRSGDIAWELRTSTSYGNLIAEINSLRNLLESRASYADRFIIEITGMPYWLSSSDDTTRVNPNDNWRYYQTVKPRSYNIWDSFIRGIATTVATWNFTPYYEVWNEPDLYFWNGTEQELLELYIHTANAIKSVDLDAKVGGLAINAWYKGVDTPNYQIVGYYPDSLADITSTITHLIDTCAITNTPLDFISWHVFHAYPNIFNFAANYFRQKLQSHNMNSTEMIITEYNTTSTLREKAWQPPMIIRFYKHIAQSEIDAHTIAALQDFTTHQTLEFFGDYGTISRGGLCKPVFRSIQLIDELQKHGGLLSVYTQEKITCFASRDNNGLRILLANYIGKPLWDGYDVLLFGSHNINNYDLAYAGYYSWGMVDSTIMGIYPPFGPPNIVAAFQEATQAYNWSLQHQIPRNLQLKLTGLTGIRNGSRFDIDSTHNNNIYKYDSLINLGYSRTQAVNLLYYNQTFEFSEIRTIDSIYDLTMQPNAVTLLYFPNISGVSLNEVKDYTAINLQIAPVFFRNNPTIMYNIKENGMLSLNIYNSVGRLIRTLQCGKVEKGEYSIGWDGKDNVGKNISAGMYFCVLKINNQTTIKKLFCIE